MGLQFLTSELNGINFATEMCCILFTAIILIAVRVKKNKNRESTAFSFFLLTLILAIASDLGAYITQGNPKNYIVFTIANTMAYTMIVICLYCFYCYLVSHSESRYGHKYSRWLGAFLQVYSIFCIVLFMSSLWTGAFFVITPDAQYEVTSLSFVTGIDVSIVYTAVYVLVVLRNFKEAPFTETLLYMVFIVLYIAFGVFDAAYMSTIHFVVMTMSAALIYILVELEQDNELTVKSRELAVSELNALRLQMNPHYIYNVLASIDGLIVFNPNDARKLIGKFIKHLRGSYLDDMPETVDVKTELKNLEYYLAVEQTRFPGLEIKFDIQADDFKVPPLVIQPLVENAIKYGICGKENSSGTVTITTYETEGTYDIIIKDDGVGYDVAGKPSDDRHHVGIANTRKRLELICNGRLELNSIIGLGSEAHIIIPKE